MMQTTIVNSPLGCIRLTADDCSLVAVQLIGDGKPHPPGEPPKGGSVLAQAAAQLAEYFAGQRTVFDVPLAPQGTAFQRLVWAELTTIPHGETRSYGDIASAIGRAGASRAVGAANARNPIAIVVPCHRVIGANGTLTGYAGGMPAKRWLLDHEMKRPRVFANKEASFLISSRPRGSHGSVRAKPQPLRHRGRRTRTDPATARTATSVTCESPPRRRRASRDRDR